VFDYILFQCEEELNVFDIRKWLGGTSRAAADMAGQNLAVLHEIA
jgi:hypothetical protein